MTTRPEKGADPAFAGRAGAATVTSCRITEAGLQTFFPRSPDWPVPTYASVSLTFGSDYDLLRTIERRVPPSQRPERQRQAYLLRKAAKGAHLNRKPSSNSS
jgi:hypothetical protein